MSLQQEIFEKSELDKEYDKILDNSDDEEAEIKAMTTLARKEVSDSINEINNIQRKISNKIQQQRVLLSIFSLFEFFLL